MSFSYIFNSIKFVLIAYENNKIHSEIELQTHTLLYWIKSGLKYNCDFKVVRLQFDFSKMI